MLFVPTTRKGDSTYSFKLGEWGAASEERGEDCNSRLERRVSPLKKIQNVKKTHSSNLTIKI